MARINVRNHGAKKGNDMARINVRNHGAKGNGKADDTQAFINAIATLNKGDTLFVPNGKYMIDAVKRLPLKSDMTFHMDTAAELHVIPNRETHYQLLYLRNVKNVTIKGGRLVGDRNHHVCGDGSNCRNIIIPNARIRACGQWGMGIFVTNGCENITIHGVTSSDMWGDGFYVGAGGEDRKPPKNIHISRCVSNNNRRQGLSVINVNGLVVSYSTFSNTRGTRPMCGIDFEPDRATDVIQNVHVYQCRFINNHTAGVEIAGAKGVHRNIRVASSYFKNNPKNFKNCYWNWWENIVYQYIFQPKKLYIKNA
jgi:hypothetical protein